MKHKRVIITGFVCLIPAFVWLGGFMLFCRTVFGYVVADELSENMPAVQERTGIVALTGGRNRIAKAVELLRSGYGERLLISGVTPGITLNEIEAREDIILDEGMQIDLGHEATDTVGNAMEVKAWADNNGYDKLNVVTSFYHIPRSRLELMRAMPEKDIRFTAALSPYVRRQYWRSQGSFLFLAAEYTKFLIVYVQYRLLGL